MRHLFVQHARVLSRPVRSADVIAARYACMLSYSTNLQSFSSCSDSQHLLSAPLSYQRRTLQTSSSHLSTNHHSSTPSHSNENDKYLPIEQVRSHIELMEKWSCSGCGIDLQSEHPKQVGYLPSQLLTKITRINELKKLRCERCYQITHYGKISDAKLPYREYEKRVAELKSKDMLMIQLVDILDITGSLLSKSRHLFGKKEVMLVVNKGDLIPEKSGIRRLMRRIQTEAKSVGIDNIRAVYLVSAMKGIGMKEIVEDIKKYRQGRDICVVGAANVGKSTFLNALLKFLVDRKWQHNHRKYMKQNPVVESTLLEEKIEEEEEENPVFLYPDEDMETYDDADDEEREMTTSPLPGTTLAVQHLPIMANNELFNVLDTPGLIVDTKRQKLIEILALDGSAQLRNVFPTKTLPMTTYRMSTGRCLFLGGLVRFDYECCGGTRDKSRLLFTWHGVIPGHLSKTTNAEETFIKHAGNLLSPPRGLDAMSFTGPLLYHSEIYLADYITKDVLTKSKHIKKPKRTSVVELEIPSFGWLSITAMDLDGTHAAEESLRNAKITISVCQGLHVVPRSPLFPYEMSTSKSSTWKS